jgi:hypothetical protein
VTPTKALRLALACAFAATACAPAATPAAPEKVSSFGVPPSLRGHGAPPPLETLKGDKRNAIAWAPLADPDDITVEGSVPSSRAWSTSKVLVIAAYLNAVVHGDPDKIPDGVRASIRAALRQSDGPSIIAIRHQIPRPGPAMARVLRTIGDRTTKVPDAFEGTMQWTVREQVRFMAALANGKVSSPEASAFLLREMQPITAQRWGLGTIDARAFKPGWMGAQAESRQMGIVGDFAVAIITADDGPVGRQAYTDYVHAWQLNRLAQLLARRLNETRCFRSELFGRGGGWCLS